MSAVLDYSDEQIMKIVRQLRLAYKLKRTPRYGATRDPKVHSESVAEHKFALLFLSRYFMQTEVLPRGLHMETVDNIILFHDFGEIPHGDKPYISKTKADEEQERLDAICVFASLPEELQELGLRSWEAFEARDGLEASFVNALDKLEPCFELQGTTNEKTLMRLGYTYEKHVGKKLAATAAFPVMRKFVEVTARKKIGRGVFIDSAVAAE